MLQQNERKRKVENRREGRVYISQTRERIIEIPDAASGCSRNTEGNWKGVVSFPGRWKYREREAIEKVVFLRASNKYAVIQPINEAVQRKDYPSPWSFLLIYVCDTWCYVIQGIFLDRCLSLSISWRNPSNDSLLIIRKIERNFRAGFWAFAVPEYTFKTYT